MKKKIQPKTSVTEQMRTFSREKALFRKVGPKDSITGRWARALNRVVEPPQPTLRDRSLSGKARVKARKAANKRVIDGVNFQ